LGHLYFDLGYWALSAPALLRGAGRTLELAGATLAAGLPAGLALAVLRALRIRPVSLLIVAAVDIARALPSIVLLFLLFFALPYADVTLSGFACAVTALAVNLAAVSEEAFHAGIEAVPSGQGEAASVLGLSRLQALRLVVLPQGIRMGIPLLTGKAISVTKDTALASVVAVPELLNQMSTEQGVYANPSPLMLGALMFLAIFFPVVWASRAVERRYRWAR
jgi:polar amino acid transport system permease protein